MCPAAEFADLLTPLRASITEQTTGEFGRPGGVKEIVPEFTCYGRKLASKEQIAAGVEAARLAWVVYADLPLHSELTEARDDLRLVSEGGTLGVFNVRSVVPFPSESMAMIECDRLNTQ